MKKRALLLAIPLLFILTCQAQTYEIAMKEITASATTGEIDKTYEKLRALHQAWPDSSKAILKKIVNIAIDEFKAGNRATAIGLLEKAKPLYDKKVTIYNVLRQLYWYEYDKKKCIEHCEATLRLDSTLVDARRYLDILQFVPDTFDVPDSLYTLNLFVRQLTVADAVLDYQAVMSSIEQIRGVFGPDDTWPQESLTFQDDINALMNHEKEHERRTAFTYTVLNNSKDKCFGCIYILPIHSKQYDAQVFYWVTKEASTKGYDKELDKAVQEWMRKSWPFKKIIYPGREVDWVTYQNCQY